MPRRLKINKRSVVSNPTVRKYMKITGVNTFQWISVYKDHSISIGSEQKLTDRDLIEVAEV